MNIFQEGNLNDIATAVKLAGDTIRVIPLPERTIKQKGGDVMEHHATVTGADFTSQDILLKAIGDAYPAINFIAEEASSDERVLKGHDYHEHLSGRLAGVDALCGTSQFINGAYEWGVSVGIMDNLIPGAGFLYSPEILNGLFVVGSKEQGVFQVNGLSGETSAKVRPFTKLEDTLISVGVDTAIDPGYNTFINEIADQSRTYGVIGSNPVALSMVATGRLDGFLQPPQRVWDWTGGHPLVEFAGGKMRFYRITNSNIEFIDRLGVEEYHPDKKEVGYIAGSEPVVEHLSKRLETLYGE